MAALLLKEGRPQEAVLQILLAVFEAGRERYEFRLPKYMYRTLMKALQPYGQEDTTLAEELINLAHHAKTAQELRRLVAQKLPQAD